MRLYRASGVLLHPTSLPGKYGIGSLGKEAFDFIDFLVEAGQKLWQICPLGPTGFGDSPYQCFSAFGGNPLLISLEKLVEEGFLSIRDLRKHPDFRKDTVDYGLLIGWKNLLLRKAYINFGKSDKLSREYNSFVKENGDWLEDYSLFMALKDLHNGESWLCWSKEYKYRDKKAIKDFKNKNQSKINFYKFIQFLFFRQWMEVKKYASLKGIKIIGDMPIFVSMDSADAWAKPFYFQFDKKLNPLKVSGVPPDYFSKTGQLWGNPLYNWRRISQDGYKWWIRRFQVILRLVDYVRVDHFRGFAANWAVRYGARTAVKGRWEKGPGGHFFEVLQKKIKNLPIIAEDLGVITPDVVEMRKRFNFPGMKILQFGFEGTVDFLPHKYERNFVAYTGTHDNDTMAGWYKKAKSSTRKFVSEYIGKKFSSLHWDVIRILFSSAADFVIIPMQDVLWLGSEARMNFPGTSSGNWRWKLKNLNGARRIVGKLKSLTLLYGR